MLVTTFLTLFLKVFSLQGNDDSKLAGSRFQLVMVLFTKVYLICDLWNTLYTRKATYASHNIEDFWGKHCCNGKAVSITYSEFMSVFLPSLPARTFFFCATLICHPWPVCPDIFLSFNQQSEYKVFYKAMWWLVGILTCRFLTWWGPLQQGDLVRSFTIDRCLASRRWVFLITHSDAPHSVGLLWTSDQLLAETSTWQHTTITTNRHPRPRWDSNTRSQQASGRRPTP